MIRSFFISFALACAIWEFVTRYFAIPVYLFPSLTRVTVEMARSSGLILTNAVVTAVEAGCGAILGCGIGLTLGCLMAISRPAQTIILPYLIGSNAIPVVAIAPLIALWFGHGIAPKIIVAAFLCFFPIAINTYDGLRDKQGVFRELFFTIGASAGSYFLKYRVPAALPFLVSGARVSMVLAVIGAVVAEFVGADAGLGFGMVQAVYSLNTPRLFAYLIVACALGLIFYALVNAIEWQLRRSGRWSWAFGSKNHEASWV